MIKVRTNIAWSRSSIRCQEPGCQGLCSPSNPLSSPTSPWQPSPPSPTSPWQCHLCQAQLSSHQVISTPPEDMETQSKLEHHGIRKWFYLIFACWPSNLLLWCSCKQTKSDQIFVVHQIEALMDKVEDDLEGLVTTRDPVLLEEMIHRQASSKQRLKYKPQTT